jgi:hypothetical protein
VLPCQGFIGKSLSLVIAIATAIDPVFDAGNKTRELKIFIGDGKK